MSEEGDRKQYSIITATDVLGIGRLADSKAAERLVDGIVQGVGGGLRSLLEPWLLRRNASAQIDIAKQTIEVLPDTVSVSLDLDQRSSLRIRREGQIRQHNREVIAEIALNNAETAIETAADAVNDATENIDHEWLAEFWNRSEQVSNEHMRVLWAKVLLSKSISPENFSIRSLNIVSQLSHEEALMIERLAPFVVEFERKDKTSHNFAAGILLNVGQYQGTFTVAKDKEEPFSEAIQGLLPDFDLVTLDAAGVMQSSNGWASTYSIVYSAEVGLTIGNQSFVLEGLPPPNERHLKSYSLGSGWGFTPEGCEVVSIINASPNPQYLRMIREAFESANCRLVDVLDE